MRLSLTGWILGGVAAGAAIGLLAPGAAPYLAVFGDLFKLGLMMLIIPLVLTSMVCGVAAVGDVRRMGRLGLTSVVYYLSTTLLAVLLGLALVNLVKPGLRADGAPALGQALEQVQGADRAASDRQRVAEIAARPTGWGEFARAQVRNLLQNPFAAAAQGNVLAVIVFALLLGGALTTLGPAGQRTLDVFRTLNDAIMKLVHLVMWAAPLGVMALLADALAAGGVAALRLLAAYSLVVVAGLLIHGALVLPTLLLLLGRRHPWRFAAAVRPALAVALGTSSSAATLPVSMQVVQQRAGVDGRVSSFVLPLGATINMDGTALYEAVAAVFIAQVYGVALGPVEQVIVFLTAALAAIGAAAIPSAGTVTMAMVLSAVGLPLDGIGLILAVDRLLDMLRTTVNVWGDLVGSAIIERLAPLPAASASSEPARDPHPGS